ncbi:MAG: hypothetical protein ACKO34_02685 [Vampirovibrionales bacterium]
MPTTVLVFLKSLATPVVLYVENPEELYAELKKAIVSVNPATPKLIEKTTIGPLKYVAFLDTDLSGLALQADMPQQAPSGPPPAAGPPQATPRPNATPPPARPLPPTPPSGGIPPRKPF